jgi:hypothetical protein
MPTGSAWGWLPGRCASASLALRSARWPFSPSIAATALSARPRSAMTVSRKVPVSPSFADNAAALVSQPVRYAWVTAERVTPIATPEQSWIDRRVFDGMRVPARVQGGCRGLARRRFAECHADTGRCRLGRRRPDARVGPRACSRPRRGRRSGGHSRRTRRYEGKQRSNAGTEKCDATDRVVGTRTRAGRRDAAEGSWADIHPAGHLGKATARGAAAEITRALTRPTAAHAPCWCAADAPISQSLEDRRIARRSEV